jgi:acyl-CoA synthetase (AMP-forming)/AMP-acid ligase II
MSFDLPTFTAVVSARAARTPQRVAFRFLTDATGDGLVLTDGELDRRARVVAAALLSAGVGGERVLLVFPPGLDFIVALVGACYAGCAAVPVQPLYPGRVDRAGARLAGVIADASPAAVLTTTTLLEAFAGFDDRFPGWRHVRVITTDTLDPAVVADPSPSMGPDTAALVQYTSGSTSAPRGVVVTHRSLLHNAEAIRRAFQVGPADRAVLWLPPHHDMGLIGGIIQPLYAEFEMILMSPLTLLQRPLRWLQAIARWRATVSGGPNFAFDLAVTRTTPEQREALRLETWTKAFTGAEPIRADTLDRFAEAFAPAGFRRSSFHPCYGLAEATLIVTGGGVNAPVVFNADPQGLEQRQARPASGPVTGRRIIGCGRAVHELQVAIVDPDSRVACEDGAIGEVWVAGTSLASGYWQAPEETAKTFHARIAGGGDTPFLRTGDLGFLRDGELFVTGRIKHLIIIDGRNHYPHDIEATAEKSHAAVRPSSAAAFAVEEDGHERLIVAVEVDRGVLRGDTQPGAEESPEQREIIQAIRRAVTEAHDVPVQAVMLLPPGGVPRTSSGKIQRHLCRQAYASRAYQAVAGQ